VPFDDIGNAGDALLERAEAAFQSVVASPPSFASEAVSLIRSSDALRAAAFFPARVSELLAHGGAVGTASPTTRSELPMSIPMIHLSIALRRRPSGGWFASAAEK